MQLVADMCLYVAYKHKPLCNERCGSKGRKRNRICSFHFPWGQKEGAAPVAGDVGLQLGARLDGILHEGQDDVILRVRQHIPQVLLGPLRHLPRSSLRARLQVRPRVHRLRTHTPSRRTPYFPCQETRIWGSWKIP